MFTILFWLLSSLNFIIHSAYVFVHSLLLRFLFPGFVFRVAKSWGNTMMKFLFVPINIVNKKKLKNISGTVVIANHQSLLDIPLLMGYLPFKFHFVLKDSLMRIPIFGYILKILNFYPINRTDPERARITLNNVIDHIKKGENIVIFSEGTRTKDGKVAPFKKGALRIAQAAKAPILPVTISGTFDACHKGQFAIKRNPIKLTLGEVVEYPKDKIAMTNLNKSLREMVAANL